VTDAAERLREAKARDEAAADEETTETEEEEATEAEEQPQPQTPQPTEKQIDKAFEAAAKSAERQGEKVAKLLGLTEDGVLPCPCCDVPGYVFAGRAPLEGDRLLAVKAVIGEDDVRQYRHDPNAVECENCNGLGKLLRPTKVPDQQLAVCSVCTGYGWHSPMQQPQQPPLEQQHVYYPPQQPQYQNGPQPPVYGQNYSG
jgi:hypothetical protein